MPDQSFGVTGTASAAEPRLCESVLFLGVPLHPLTMSETVALVGSCIRNRRPVQHVALNVAKFVKLRRDLELQADVFGADIVGVDGMGILLGARLFGLHVPERVAGVDLMEEVLNLCAHEGFRPYLLGAKPEVVGLAVRQLAERYPKLELAGFHHGYFAPEDEAEIVEKIRATKPDCLFVGMPTPRKERFMAAHRMKLDLPFVMGVGGGLDILAGHLRRAPAAWQRSGFEWLYRTLQEPRRMWRRYLTTNLSYAWILGTALIGKVAPH